MKKTFFISSVIILFGLSLISQADEPYAPKLKAPSNIKEGSPAYLGVVMLKSAEVPPKSSVGIPPYPGALIIQTTKGMEMEIRGNKQTCYPYIKMLSSDDGDTVISFYKEKLKGYKYVNQFGGMIRVFWQGNEDFNPMDMDQRCTTVAVQVSDGDIYKELMPDVKSSIEITYQP
ncbi:MAG: hypothetical protein PVI06_07455 [Desulfobacterales bacterium]|jgi:hypothetical protein